MNNNVNPRSVRLRTNCMNRAEVAELATCDYDRAVSLYLSKNTLELARLLERYPELFDLVDPVTGDEVQVTRRMRTNWKMIVAGAKHRSQEDLNNFLLSNYSSSLVRYCRAMWYYREDLYVSWEAMQEAMQNHYTCKTWFSMSRWFDQVKCWLPTIHIDHERNTAVLEKLLEQIDGVPVMTGTPLRIWYRGRSWVVLDIHFKWPNERVGIQMEHSICANKILRGTEYIESLTLLDARLLTNV